MALVASNATMDGGKMQRSSDKYWKQESREREGVVDEIPPPHWLDPLRMIITFLLVLPALFLRGHCQDHKIANLLGSLAEASQNPNKSPEQEGMEVEIW